MAPERRAFVVGVRACELRRPLGPTRGRCWRSWLPNRPGQRNGARPPLQRARSPSSSACRRTPSPRLCSACTEPASPPSTSDGPQLARSRLAPTSSLSPTASSSTTTSTSRQSQPSPCAQPVPTARSSRSAWTADSERPTPHDHRPIDDDQPYKTSARGARGCCVLRVTTLYAASAAATPAYYGRYLALAPGEVPGVWTVTRRLRSA
jgi:hypothetical protein